MKKFKETILTMFFASRYSLAFCWRNNKKATIARMIISIINTAVLYLTIQITGQIVNAVQNASGKFDGTDSMFIKFMNSGLILPILFVIGVLILGVVASKFNEFFRSNWNQSLRMANDREMNDHKATLDVAMINSKEYDDFSKRIQELPTSWQTRIWFSEAMFNLFSTLVSFILFGISLLWYKPIYAVVLVLSSIPMIIVEFRLVSMWWNLFQHLVPKYKERSVLEKPFREHKAFVQSQMFNQMPALRNEIDIINGDVLNEYHNIRKFGLKKETLTQLVSVFGLCGVIVYAMIITAVSRGSLGELTIIMAAARTFQGNLNSIVSTVAEQWNSAKGVILIEKDFFGLKPIVQTEYPVIPRFDITPKIKVDHVSFIYPGSTVEVLKDISFSVAPGSKIAIVGKSGSGKSTIQALLMRYYDPTGGDIFAEDINFKNIKPNVWNNIASSLTQEYTVISRRVGAEIASSRLGQIIDQDAMVTASRLSNFDEVIDRDPDGYNSQIGVELGGRDYSGGEKQRLALARVYYRGTRIIILDEPDAKLDPDSAQKVVDYIFTLVGITVIMITHHVSRAERCDHIIVMDKGQIAEQGSHHALMENGGLYASMNKKDKERLGFESDSES